MRYELEVDLILMILVPYDPARNFYRRAEQELGRKLAQEKKSLTPPPTFPELVGTARRRGGGAQAGWSRRGCGIFEQPLKDIPWGSLGVLAGWRGGGASTGGPVFTCLAPLPAGHVLDKIERATGRRGS